MQAGVNLVLWKEQMTRSWKVRDGTDVTDPEHWKARRHAWNCIFSGIICRHQYVGVLLDSGQIVSFSIPAVKDYRMDYLSPSFLVPDDLKTITYARGFPGSTSL